MSDGDARVLLKAWNAVIGDSQNVRSTGNALHILGESEAAIHTGHAYHVGVKMILESEQTVFMAATPGEHFMHWDGLSCASITGPIEIDFYRHSVVGSGTPITVHNRNFEYTDTNPTTGVVQSVNVLTTTGELVFPAANVAAPALGGLYTPSEIVSLFDGFILISSETYTIGLHNTSNDDTTLWINFSYFEPETL